MPNTGTKGFPLQPGLKGNILLFYKHSKNNCPEYNYIQPFLTVGDNNNRVQPKRLKTLQEKRNNTDK